MYVRFLCFFLLAPSLLAVEEKKPKAESPAGAWQVVSAKFNGEDSPALKGRTLVFGDKEFTTYDGEKKGRTVEFTLDTGRSPKQIDLKQGADGNKALGIYVLDKDELTICYAEPGSARPTKPQSLAGERQFLLVLKRVKKD